MQLPDGYDGTYYIPAIIREYFPNDLVRFFKGKGYEWFEYGTLFGETWENRRYKEVSALANGETAIVKQAIINEIHWYTIEKAKEEEKERLAAEAQAKKWEAEQRAKEEARQAQIKKAAAESKARREKEVAEARKQQVKKGAKGFGILYIVVIVLCLLLFVFNLLGGAKLAVDLLIIAVIVYFVIKRKRKDE